MKIREFKDSDAKEVCEIIRRCDEEIASKDYSEGIINLWAEKLTPEYILNKSKKRICYVASLKNRIVGYISLDGNEIMKLHVNPDYHRRGIGKALFRKLEDYSIKNNFTILVVESSISAEKFYEKCGFNNIKTKYCEDRGNKFELILMEKKLK